MTIETIDDAIAIYNKANNIHSSYKLPVPIMKTLISDFNEYKKQKSNFSDENFSDSIMELVRNAYKTASYDDERDITLAEIMNLIPPNHIVHIRKDNEDTPIYDGNIQSIPYDMTSIVTQIDANDFKNIYVTIC